MEIDDVRSMFEQFQQGYTRRDPAHLDAFMQLFVAEDELEIVGTNAVVPAEGEWCRGQAAARRLVEGDWAHWGDVVFDVAGAHISALGDVAWLATTGTVTDTITAEERTDAYLAYVERVLQGEMNPLAKMRTIVGLGSHIVLGLPLSETYTWPFRFTAVAVRQDGKWRFHQIHFSFPTTGEPDVRLGQA